MKNPGKVKKVKPAWFDAMAKYQKSDPRQSSWQLINTLVPYTILWALMVYTIQQQISYWLTLALAIVTGGFLIRVFIIFHDCTHGSFFASKKLNAFWGYITGILTFTPYDSWRHSHIIHHATAGNLDKRGVGDVFTMTVEEYQNAPPNKRHGYWLMRNPLVLFGLGPGFMFIVANRFTKKADRQQDRRSVYITDAALLLIVVIASLTIGLRTYVLIQLPVILTAATAGMWLFYVQHQFESVYWKHEAEWNRLDAAIQGSSYYKLPKFLQWFTGNIGLHHIHHARPLIPNYALQPCYNAIPDLQSVKPLSIGESLKSLHFNLWDEKRQTLVSFREARLAAQR